MTRGHSIDRFALHEYLWEKTDRFGKVEIYQSGLAEELSITASSMSLIIQEMIRDRRIRKIAAKKANIGTYQVADPATFEHPYQRDPASKLVPRCKRCGLMKEVGPHPTSVGR